MPESPGTATPVVRGGTGCRPGPRKRNRVVRRAAAFGTTAFGAALVAALASSALAASAKPVSGVNGPAVFVQTVRGLLFAGNAGSASVSTFASNPAGSLTPLGSPVSTDAGIVDSAASPSGRFLYVETGAAGIVDEFAVSSAGARTEVGSVTVPGAVGGEGIAVS